MADHKRDYYTVIFRDAETGRTGMRLTPEGGLTRKTMYAAMIPSKERAEEIAATIRGNFPEATVSVKPF